MARHEILPDMMSLNEADQTFDLQDVVSSGPGVLGGGNFGNLGIEVDALCNIRMMLQQLQTGPLAVEVWQGMMLMLLVQLKRRSTHLGVEACLTESVFGLLLQVLPNALPEAAPMLSAIRPSTRIAMLRPPSCLAQDINEHVLAALPTTASDVLQYARPNPQGMEMLRRLSTVVMNGALGVTVGKAWQDDSDVGGSQQQQNYRGPSQAALARDRSALDEGRLVNETSKGTRQMRMQQQSPQHTPQQLQPLQLPQQPPHRPLPQPPQPSQKQQDSLLEHMQQLLWRQQDSVTRPPPVQQQPLTQLQRLDESCSSAGSLLESPRSPPPVSGTWASPGDAGLDRRRDMLSTCLSHGLKGGGGTGAWVSKSSSSTLAWTAAASQYVQDTECSGSHSTSSTGVGSGYRVMTSGPLPNNGANATGDGPDYEAIAGPLKQAREKRHGWRH